MNYYVSKDSVVESIEYFKNAGFDSDDMLFLLNDPPKMVHRSTQMSTTFEKIIWWNSGSPWD